MFKFLKRGKLFASILLVILLAACQPKAPSTNTSSSGKPNSGEKTLTVWHIETGESEVALKNAAKRFEEKHPGVTVKLVRYENDPYKTKLSVAMGGGNPPDVFHSWGGGWLKNFVDAGQVMDITNKIDKDNYLEAAISPATYDGKIYGVPVGMDIVPVWYNREIFEKYNLKEPKTYDEFLEIIKTLKSKGIIPLALANKTKWPGSFYMMYLAERIGGKDLFNEAFGRTGRGFDDEAYVQAARKIQELVKMGAFPEGVNGLNYDTGQSRQLLYTGKAAMTIDGSWFLGTIRKEMPEFEEKLGFFMFPIIEGGKGTNKDIVGGVSPVYSVSEKSPNKDLAVELIKEFASKETAQEMANKAGVISAVKGVKYEDGYIKKINSVLENAEFMQTYYDQTLPTEVATEHLDTTQALFGLSITPEEAVKRVEQKAKEVIEKK
ncbi:extracellular solute-binding protein [Geobacillus subterraneus]|uniref:Sugar ABC transporter substrate-binding protein n=1 Tax=Geobacillus thermopakistaniensis (strain MAS1) TaxID=1408282 RepID=A0A7U9P6U7_GEOTM|nr:MULTISPECIES: extracellular solute-binding protein [Geobacillus]ESU73062.1 sugar ABC transporter substrate-binding protein [Geobacillus sp. MAS1]WMJ18518.1 extracellular solute-binding protein [Geobacillus kaustophilus]WPZ16911.1 extracellular solute-binding protein [Geobacillus subterraneus]